MRGPELRKMLTRYVRHSIIAARSARMGDENEAQTDKGQQEILF